MIDPRSLAKLGRFSTVPDLQERLREVYAGDKGGRSLRGEQTAVQVRP